MRVCEHGVRVSLDLRTCWGRIRAREERGMGVRKQRAEGGGGSGSASGSGQWIIRKVTHSLSGRQSCVSSRRLGLGWWDGSGRLRLGFR